MATTTSLFAKTILGRTGLEAGRLGLSASYGMPTAAVERAFERGMNYLYWGSLRRDAFAHAVRNLKHQREQMVLVVQSYARFPGMLTRSVERALRQLTLDHVDVLLLGWWNGPIWPRVLDAALEMKERRVVHHLAVSTHNRPNVLRLAGGGDVDLFHVRYNAVHRGAERDIFPHLPSDDRPGLVAFTATCWRKLLDARRVPAGEPVPTAGDCYRFVLSQPAIDVCMSGFASLEDTEHALAALEKGPMAEDELAWMRRVGDTIYGKKR
jgi:aryl-alcohol dehydrogenase-like predicted oxidoreductase